MDRSSATSSLFSTHPVESRLWGAGFDTTGFVQSWSYPVEHPFDIAMAARQEDEADECEEFQPGDVSEVEEEYAQEAVSLVVTGRR